MTDQQAREKLFHLFNDDETRDAIVTIIEGLLDAHRFKLSYRSGDGDFFRRAADLIEASGGVMALENVITVFNNLRAEYLNSQSPPEDAEQE